MSMIKQLEVGTRLIVTLPFEPSPFEATISTEEPPANLKDCYRIECLGGTMKGRIVNVDHRSVSVMA